MYHTIKDIISHGDEMNLAFHQVVLKNEMKISESSKEEIYEELKARYETMKESASKALHSEKETVGTLITGIAKTEYNHSISGQTVCGSFINKVMARALSCSEVNASMGKICAAPTAGACGILPAVLTSLEEEYGFLEASILDALLVASGIGAVIMENATVAGAKGGCQAECGVAAAMAAGATVSLKGGTSEMIGHSVSLALMNCMGLICDPVAGLVQIPCAQRNASQAINGLISADLALGGMKSIIPVDEVIDAMYRVGTMLPSELKETALGGIAKTPSAKQIEKEIYD